MTHRALLLTLTFAVPARILAEEPSASSSPALGGPRVRLTAPSVFGERLVGAVVGIDETTLTLQRQDGKGTLQVPRRWGDRRDDLGLLQVVPRQDLLNLSLRSQRVSFVVSQQLVQRRNEDTDQHVERRRFVVD